jgi:hypothetical protein
MMSAIRTHVRRETLVTWILALATIGVLTSIAVACRRAHLEAKAALGEPRLTAVASSSSPGLFVVSGGDDGGDDLRPELEPEARRRHLRVVGA